MATRTFRTIEEVELLEGCASHDELGARYEKKFGKPKNPKDAVSQHIRVGSLWTARKTVLLRLPAMRAERDRKAKTLMVPVEITHKGSEKKTSAFADDALMVKIHNELALLVQLQREANDIHAKQFELFERRLDATVKHYVDKVIKERGIELSPAERAAVTGLVQIGGATS